MSDLIQDVPESNSVRTGPTCHQTSSHSCSLNILVVPGKRGLREWSHGFLSRQHLDGVLETRKRPATKYNKLPRRIVIRAPLATSHYPIEHELVPRVEEFLLSRNRPRAAGVLCPAVPSSSPFNFCRILFFFLALLLVTRLDSSREICSD